LIEAGSLFPFQLRHESNGISIINISNFSISVEEVGKGRDGKERWERKGRKGGKQARANLPVSRFMMAFWQIFLVERLWQQINFHGAHESPSLTLGNLICF
jgi:hypothetical protein